MSNFVQFVCGDFEAAWSALAADTKAGHRGNLMFASLAGVLIQGALNAGVDVADGLMLENARYGEFPALLPYLRSPVSVYSELPMPLPSGEACAVGFTGALPGRFLDPEEKPERHLALEDGQIYVRTDRLYLDVKAVLRKAGRL